MGNNSSRPKAVIAWTSGKDGALALYRSFHQSEYQILSLLTTVAGDLVQSGRVETLERQLEAVKLPVVKVLIPAPCPNAVYEERWAKALKPWKAKGVSTVLFADESNEEIRRHREQMLAKFGMKAVFPAVTA